LNKQSHPLLNENIIWRGCNTTVAGAIDEFVCRWKPYSIQSKKRNLARLFGMIVEPSWRRYLDSLPSSHPARELSEAAELDLGHLASEYGFAEFRVQLERIASAAQRSGHGDAGDFDSFFPEAGKGLPLATPSTDSFDETVASLITLVSRCGMKRHGRTTKDVDGVNPHRGNEFCSFCGAQTEVRTYLVLDEGCRRRLWPHEGEKLIPKLSNKFCVDHRPFGHDGRSNAVYHQARRKKTQFEVEVRRLHAQSTTRSKPIAATGNVALDHFYLALIRREWPDAGDFLDLRDHANDLARQKITDKKKFIAILNASGIAQSEIGRRLGMTRQAVHKALGSLPKNYRFDRPTTR
jgi:hypothetical protein